MNIHFSKDDKFLDSFIENSKKYTDTENIYVVISKNKKLRYTNSNNVIIIKASVNAVNLLLERYRPKNIYFHALTVFYYELVNNLKLDVRFTLIWLFYGYEVFGMRKILKQKFLKSTFKIYKKERKNLFFEFDLNPINFRRNVINFKYYSRIQDERDNLIKSLIKKIHYIGHFIYEDLTEHIYEINPKIKFIEWNYLSANDLKYDKRFIDHDHKKTRILLGNSASPFNNHIDALKFLHKKIKKRDNIEIILPLNYSGSDFYIENVIDIGFKLFEHKFKPITNFLEKNEYYSLLKTIDIAFFYNLRSQAAGNINWFLNNNTPVFMRRESSLYKFYKRKGFLVYPTQEFKDDYELIDLKTKNHDLIHKEFGDSNMRDRYKVLLELNHTVFSK